MQIAIIGLGREGWSSFQFLQQMLEASIHFVLVDDLAINQLPKHWQAVVENNVGQVTLLTSEIFLTQTSSNIDAAMITPGIAPSHPVAAWLDRAQVFQTSNTQLFLDIVLPDRATKTPFTTLLPHLNQQPTIIGVTGTKGKSTTTAAIHHVLSASGKTAWLGGNIGTAPLDLLSKIEANTTAESYVALELSAHQLARLTTSPQIAVVLAITPEHLDYYPDFDAYAEAKSAICQYQKSTDVVLYNLDNKTAQSIAQRSAGTAKTFSANDASADCFIQSGAIMVDDTTALQTETLKVVGQHTLLNLLPSVLISYQAGLATDQIVAGLQSFTGLPHRLQFVTDLDQVRYFNDSLATTPEAAAAAIASFPDQRVILIAGGFDRGLDYTPLAQAILDHQVKAALLLPTTGSKIAQAVSTTANQETTIEQVPSLEVAVTRAKDLAEPGDVVLLSPASASFNQFKDYADRGDQFIRLVTQQTLV